MQLKVRTHAHNIRNALRKMAKYKQGFGCLDCSHKTELKICLTSKRMRSSMRTDSLLFFFSFFFFALLVVSVHIYKCISIYFCVSKHKVCVFFIGSYAYNCMLMAISVARCNFIPNRTTHYTVMLPKFSLRMCARVYVSVCICMSV